MNFVKGDRVAYAYDDKGRHMEGIGTIAAVHCDLPVDAFTVDFGNGNRETLYRDEITAVR